MTQCAMSLFTHQRFHRDLIDAGASPADLFYKLLIFQFERMPANAGLLAQLMRKAAEMGGLQVGCSSGPACICRQPMSTPANQPST